MSTSQPRHKPSLPRFEPLPPTNILNRIINCLLAPLFYLVFTVITAVVVVPIYVIIDNFKHGPGKHGGKRFAKDESEEYPGQPEKSNKAASFLRGYGQSHSGASKSEKLR